jgi:exopolysaccharide biosynthesis polyprenyl glycosylphosphotransferase
MVDSFDVNSLWFATVLAIVWWSMLGLWGTRDKRVLGSGAEEYKRVAAASGWLFGFVAVFSYGFQIETARGFVGLAFPAGTIGLLVARWLVRQHLRLDRRQGRSVSKVLVVGGPHSAEHLIRSLRTEPGAGYFPVAAHLPGEASHPRVAKVLDVPVTGTGQDVDSLIDAIKVSAADTVAITAGALVKPKDLRRLGWELAAQDVDMILAPALTDVAGPRIHTQPVAGLPLVHVTTPVLTGGKSVAKRAFDIVFAGLLTLTALPLFVLIALLIKVTSRGPVFYYQERVGIHGTTFKMLKFRSMRVDADAELQELLKAQGSDGTPLFKVNNDPRITKIGKVLRKYSLDELPQLLNVLNGTMSLVGPRPQRSAEVQLYDVDAHRRLYVSPGMSGLWQVSGRSNLSWEESIRLDLYYVENWSLMSDLLILLRTFRAVFTSHGAV